MSRNSYIKTRQFLHAEGMNRVEGKKKHPENKKRAKKSKGEKS
jgi:hypothetical protein